MKKVLLILGILILLGGAVVGLGIFGVVKIPGLPVFKNGKLVFGDKPKNKPDPPVVAKAPAPINPPTDQKSPDKPGKSTKLVKPKAPPPDLNKGAESVAGLWNEMEASKVVAIVADWKDPDVARVFLQMDATKVAEVLGQMDPKRASKISQMVQKQASVATDAS